MMSIDTTNMCSHLQKKLFEEDGIYHSLWIAMQDDPELTAAVRSRQLHIYRNGKKVLVLAGKSAPKIIREDSICELLQIERIKWMEHRFNNALVAIMDGSADSLKAIKEEVAELSKYYGSELWKQDFAADEAGNLPPDLKRGVLSEDGIWNLLSVNQRGQSQTRLSYAERKQARPKVKWKAKQGSWRISEASLLMLAVIGGTIGALLGMQVWRHKTMHLKFKYGLPLILLAQIALMYLISEK